MQQNIWMFNKNFDMHRRSFFCEPLKVPAIFDEICYFLSRDPGPTKDEISH